MSKKVAVTIEVQVDDKASNDEIAQEFAAAVQGWSKKQAAGQGTRDVKPLGNIQIRTVERSDTLGAGPVPAWEKATC